YLIFLGGAVRISHPAMLTPPPIKSANWMPSSPNWGLSKPYSSRTTPRAHRPLTGHWPSPSEWRAGVAKNLLLRNANAPGTGGDLALRHARDQKRREACGPDVRQVDLPSHVSMAGRKVLPRRGRPA